MTTFAPKIYQQQVLDSIECYFKTCHELPSPSIALMHHFDNLSPTQRDGLLSEGEVSMVIYSDPVVAITFDPPVNLNLLFSASADSFPLPA